MDNFTDEDKKFMDMAIGLARRVKGLTNPNPAVGAVVVRRGVVVGKGATEQWGGAHAEKKALRSAAARGRGATLYVTLEPCCHFGRTAPCTDSVIAAGIARVVVALQDPNPLVAGKGIRILRKHGIVVSTGLRRMEAFAVNEDFFLAITRRRAFITLKLALTLDGRIADSTGKSKWITPVRMRRVVHGLRATHAAVAVGNGTLLSDDPSLTVRYGRRTNPARVVFTSSAAVPKESFFYCHAGETRSIVVIRGSARREVVIDPATKIEYWHTGESDPVTSMKVFSEMAFEQNILSVFVEGGQKIASAFLDACLVDRLYLFYGNKIVGRGMDGILTERALPVASGIVLRKRRVQLISDDFYITGIPSFPQDHKTGE